MAQSYFLEKKTFEIINLGIFSKFVEGKTNVVFQNSVSFQNYFPAENLDYKCDVNKCEIMSPFG